MSDQQWWPFGHCEDLALFALTGADNWFRTLWCELRLLTLPGGPSCGPFFVCGRDLLCGFWVRWQRVVVLTVPSAISSNDQFMDEQQLKQAVPQWYGDESAQRKRYLKSEEETLAKAFGPDWRRALAERGET